jgi:hypothetical protein
VEQRTGADTALLDALPDRSAIGRSTSATVTARLQLPGRQAGAISRKPSRIGLMTFSHAYTQPRSNRDVGVATAFLASDYAKMITGDAM